MKTKKHCGNLRVNPWGTIFFSLVSLVIRAPLKTQISSTSDFQFLLWPLEDLRIPFEIEIQSNPFRTVCPASALSNSYFFQIGTFAVRFFIAFCSGDFAPGFVCCPAIVLMSVVCNFFAGDAVWRLSVLFLRWYEYVYCVPFNPCHGGFWPHSATVLGPSGEA